MTRYDVFVRTQGKMKCYKNRPLPPRPPAGAVKAVERQGSDELWPRNGVWVDARLFGSKYASDDHD